MADSEDRRFGELVVAQGLCSREKVDECLSLIARLAAEGVTPLPRLGELLARKGYLTPTQVDATLRPATARRTADASPLPPEAEEAAANGANHVGRYVKVSRLGAGGMGEVWRAWDRDLRRWVALKFLHYDDPAQLARFRREAQTAASLNHPNIASVYEVGEANGKPFLAMQLVQGTTLATLPRDDARRGVALVRDAALAVHHAHEQGVIHRDLKPHNLMVEGTRVFVMDFGLAKPAAVDSSLSIAGSVLGTPAYMPPEQARGDAARVGPRSDVYALGATLYDLLTGGPPFQDTEVYALLKRVVEEEPVPLRRRNGRLDRELETIVMKCLEKEPDARYAGARELAEDLTRWLAGEAIQAHPPSWAYRARKLLARRRAVVLTAAAVAVAAFAIFLPNWLGARS
ncbi:MAG TPA: serine/threonine-protein kinase, partial [Planctomycetota bacterium]|nr:serine/threonine-protein kinase [Planctomycetota bacterium]